MCNSVTVTTQNVEDAGDPGLQSETCFKIRRKSKTANMLVKALPSVHKVLGFILYSRKCPPLQCYRVNESSWLFNLCPSASILLSRESLLRLRLAFHSTFFFCFVCFATLEIDNQTWYTDQQELCYQALLQLLCSPVEPHLVSAS